MLDFFSIFTKGGVVLWSLESSSVDPSYINTLIQEVLLEERKAQTSYTIQSHSLKWTFANDLGLVFVAAYLSRMPLPWLDDFLTAVKNDFTSTYRSTLLSPDGAKTGFNYSSSFKALLNQFENQSIKGRGGITVPKVSIPSTSNPSSSSSSSSLSSTEPSSVTSPETSTNGQPSNDATTSSSSSTTTHQPSSPTVPSSPTSMGPDGLLGPETLLGRRSSTGAKAPRSYKEIQEEKRKKMGGASHKDTNKDGKETGTKPTVTKQATRWEGKLSAAESAQLNMSDEPKGNSDGKGVDDAVVAQFRSIYGEGPKVGERYADVDDVEEVDDEKSESGPQSPGVGGDNSGSTSGMWGFFKGLVGQKELTEDDLAPVAKELTEQLVKKNVANEVAEKLVNSVVRSLLGQKPGTFSTLKSVVRQGLEEALTRLLTPAKPIDVMAGVMAAREQNRPYSIVFCGVNGVGKSTSLAKVAAYFRSHDLKVGVAACDTFRSGAIEQLRTHCAALNLPLYDKGYGKDEAAVAQDGIAQAKRDGLNVILIDTAGRMQGKDALMKGLAKLMNMNNPDLILFVGEALVGNDGCDQLINFNNALKQNSDRDHPRLIDGIVLTKFDTIDDKVGAAISMTYSTGQPILFVGTGQTYRDLKKPNAKMLIHALLK